MSAELGPKTKELIKLAKQMAEILDKSSETYIRTVAAYIRDSLWYLEKGKFEGVLRLKRSLSNRETPESWGSTEAEQLSKQIFKLIKFIYNNAEIPDEEKAPFMRGRMSTLPDQGTWNDPSTKELIGLLEELSQLLANHNLEVPAFNVRGFTTFLRDNSYFGVIGFIHFMKHETDRFKKPPGFDALAQKAYKIALEIEARVEAETDL